MSQSLQPKYIGFLTVTLLALILAVGLLKTGLLTEIENRSWDWRIKLTVEPDKADPSIAIIMIDQSSLEFFAQEESIFWPWPRGMYEAVIRFLQSAKARGAAFDIIFSEQSSYGVDDDEAFAGACTPEMPVVSAVALRRTATAVKQSDFKTFRERIEIPPETAGVNQSYLSPVSKENLYSAVTLPVPPLLRSSAAFGNVTAQPDSDGIYRHTTTGHYIHGVPVLGLPFALFEAGKRELPRLENISRYMDEKGNIAVNFHGPARTYKTYRMSAVIQSFRQIQNGENPLIPLDAFRDAWVFVGMDAPGLLDLRPTPLSELYPGVEFHATVLDNLLHDNFAVKTSFFENLLLTLILSSLAAASVIFFADVRFQLGALFLLSIAALAFWYYSALWGYWVAVTVPVVATIGSVLGGLGFQYQLEGRQHRFIKNAFKFYLSPEIIEEIVKDPTSLSLGGERRELTIFFSDLAGFTSISESIDPQQLVTLLNQYLTAMTDIILKSGGTLDKYEGDAIIAFWNAPLAIEDHASRAVQAALDCQLKLEEMRPALEQKYGVSLKMRIGMNTGAANVGNFGSEERFNYTVIGDAANLAARLEGVNKVFGTSLLFPQSTFDKLAGSIPCRKIGDIRVVGKSFATSVYEPIPAGFDLVNYNRALLEYESGNLHKALEFFEGLKGDLVAESYVAKIRHDISNVNAEPFDPVWTLSSK